MTYASALTAGRHQMARRNQNTVTLRSTTKALGPVANMVILIVLACLIGLLYLMQVTKTNAYGYKVNDLSNKQQQLKAEYATLELESARLQALDRVKNSEVAKALTAPVSVSTVQN